MVKIQGGRWDDDDSTKVEPLGQMSIPATAEGSTYVINTSMLEPSTFKSSKFVRWAISVNDGKKNRVYVSRYFYSTDLKSNSTTTMKLSQLLDRNFRPIGK